MQNRHHAMKNISHITIRDAPESDQDVGIQLQMHRLKFKG